MSRKRGTQHLRRRRRDLVSVVVIGFCSEDECPVCRLLDSDRDRVLDAAPTRVASARHEARFDGVRVGSRSDL